MSCVSFNGNNDSKLLKDKFSCIHIETYKALEGVKAYEIVHSLFVSCQNHEYCANKANECKCIVESCTDSKYERLHGCLYCAFFGCRSEHIQEHANEYGHPLAIDINSGHVYCFECKDYKYDNEFEEIAKEQNLIAAIQRSDLDQGYNLVSTTMKQDEALFKLYPSELPGKNIPNSSSVNEITGLRGIFNMGHTCYMSVILQSLLHAPILRDHFLSDKHSKKCNVKNQETSDNSAVCFSCELGKIVQEFYSKTSNEVYFPHEFIFLVWKHAPAYMGNNMQCAHEFLISLLKLLHKDCKESSGDNKYKPDHYANCIMEKIFTGVSRLDITCGSCKTTKENIQVFNDISLFIDHELDEYKELKLEDCLKRLTEPTQEGYKRTCDICESQQMCTETTKFRKLPIITIFRNQLSNIIDFPEALDMTPFVSYCKNGSSPKLINCNKYHLFAAVHYKPGSTRDGGHYVCYIRMHDKRWYHCNDADIVLKPFTELKKIPMSLLFYHQEYLQYNVGNMLKEQVKGS